MRRRSNSVWGELNARWARVIVSVGFQCYGTWIIEVIRYDVVHWSDGW